MKYLLDSDFLYGLNIKGDAHHDNSLRVFKKMAKLSPELSVLNLVVQETATVISRRVGQKESLIFLDRLAKLPVNILWIGEEDENLSWSLFKKQTKKGTSFVDCANLAVAEKYQFDGVLSFDHFYPKSVRITSQ